MPKKEKTKYLAGTIRVKKNLKPVEYKKGKWVGSKKKLPGLMHAAELFKAHNNFDILLDKKKPEFLKGFLTKDGKARGARVNVLPDGKKIDKAYSLFADELTFHDESSNSHWDVLYKNPGGTYAYCYTLEKKKKASKKKYSLEKDFEKSLPKLEKNLLKGLRKGEKMALPMYTLMKTYMRVGNEIYFKARKHKGLTTLKKSDVSLKGKNVTFDYLSKGGVPRKITEEFPESYIKQLKKLLKNKKKNDFVFADKNGRPMKDTKFKEAFKKYCGKEFYPHIVRSYYATKRAEDFLEENKKPSKKEVRELYSEIAEKLGHKKYSKKKHEWEDSYNVTVRHYISPKIVEKLKKLSEKKK